MSLSNYLILRMNIKSMCVFCNCFFGGALARHGSSMFTQPCMYIHSTEYAVPSTLYQVSSTKYGVQSGTLNALNAIDHAVWDVHTCLYSVPLPPLPPLYPTLPLLPCSSVSCASLFQSSFLVCHLFSPSLPPYSGVFHTNRWAPLISVHPDSA